MRAHGLEAARTWLVLSSSARTAHPLRGPSIIDSLTMRWWGAIGAIAFGFLGIKAFFAAAYC